MLVFAKPNLHLWPHRMPVSKHNNAGLRWKKHGVEKSWLLKKGYIGSFFGKEKVKGKMLLPSQPGLHAVPKP